MGQVAREKVTVAQQLASDLGWHYLDSGAIYRAMAWATLASKIDPDDQDALSAILDESHIQIQSLAEGGVKVSCQGKDISAAIRAEEIGLTASKISSNPMVRKKLLELQVASRKWPGLVADGRDMGTVVFVDAELKFFLQASLEERAQRRHKQLQEKAINVSLAQIKADLAQRDERDRKRSISPALPASEAIIIDTTCMSVREVMLTVKLNVQKRFNLGAS